MNTRGLTGSLTCLMACVVVSSPAATTKLAPPTGDLSPAALAASQDGKTIYVACATANQVLAFDPERREITRRLAVPGPPSGLAVTADGARLVVTCAEPASRVCVLETATGKCLKTFTAGHTALSPVLSRDGKSLFVCNRFNDAVSLFDLDQSTETARIPVVREPVSAVLTADGRFLLVANHLPQGRSDVDYVAATVSVIEVAAHKVIKNLRLPNGSFSLRQMCVSPDGKYACVPLTVGRFQLPVTQVERGWVNASAVAVIDLEAMDVLNAVLVDEVERGAANPWGAGWSADGHWFCVTHAGTHELSVIDFPALLTKLRALPATPPGSPAKAQDLATRSIEDVPNDLSFLTGLRHRVKLHGNGPRALAIIGDRAFVASYFSDSLDAVKLSEPNLVAEPIALNRGREATPLRRGEMYFNDATLCFQGWQSCASCHDDDGRVDALNWDLLNDGIGNPKDTKSLVLSHQTPPVMSLGVRANAGIAVRSGIANSLVSAQQEEVAAAMDEWLSSLKPAPSPHLVNGRLSEAAQRGEKLFKSPAVGCASCHEPGLLTDLQSYDVGTRGSFDGEERRFDTPTLVELWRTAPYLHDGSAASVRDVLTTRNPKDEHGKTSQLTAREMDDLVEFVLSL